MNNKTKQIKGYVKTETLLLAIGLALVLGFISGVAFTVYRSTGTNEFSTSHQKAENHADQAKLSEIKAMQQQVANSPDDIQAWTRLAHLYFDTGQKEKAIKAYEKSLDLDSKRPDVWVDLGVMYRRSGKKEKAMECFSRALQIDPRHKIALYNQGIVMMHDFNNPRGAIKSWKKLVAIDPQAVTPSGVKVKQLILELEKNQQ